MKLGPLRIRGANSLEPATLRDFSGGLNTVDDDLNLDRRFAKVMTNCHYGVDTGVSVRYGVRLFADINSLSTSGITVRAINCEYYNNALIVVGSTGEVFRLFGDGTGTVLWPYNSWSPCEFASFAQFNGELIICNGIDKPLIVNTSFDCSFLQDLATETNINTPVARYVISSNRYLLMAGDPQHPDRLYISARDTSGTWPGDPVPNDATYIDLGSSLKDGGVIKGIADFRGRVIVTYAAGCIIGQTGIYDNTGAHIPNFDDSVEQYGAISHRGIQSYGDDLLMMDQVGVPSLKRTVFTGTIRPERVSDFVDNGMSALLKQLTFVTMEDQVFSVYDQVEGTFMFFIPNANANATQTIGFAFTFRQNLKVSAWYRIEGWNFTCGTRSAEGRVFFGDKNGKIWVKGSEAEPVYVDYKNDPTINSGQGVPINWVWELPWADFNSRMATKTTRYISFDTRGRAKFTCQAYLDRVELNGAYERVPHMSMDFIGGDILGFGDQDQPFGGGRITTDERLFSWPAKFKLLKLRLSGSTTEPLSFHSISFLYRKGNFKR